MKRQSVKTGLFCIGLGFLVACNSGGGGDTTNNDDNSNAPPVADAGSGMSTHISTGSVTLDASASSDPDNDILSYEWMFIQLPAGSNTTLNSSSSVTTTFTPDIKGLYQVQLTVSDGIDSHSVITDIEITNATPVAIAGQNQRFLMGSGNVILDGSASADPDNDSLSFSWALIQQPPGSSSGLVAADEMVASFTPDLVGSYRIELTVSDGYETHSNVLDVDAADNTLPSASAGADIEAGTGHSVSLNASGSSDPDGQDLTYTWTQIRNQCPDVTGGSGRLTGAQPAFLTPASVCTLIFDLRVNDGIDTSPADRIYIFVMEDPAAAIFVDGSAGSDTGPGTRSQPYRTIVAAISAAQTADNGSDIYITGSSYSSGSLSLYDNISLYGGFNQNWERDTTRNRTQLQGATPMIYGNGADNLTLDGLTITGLGSTTGSSYAIYLRSGNGITLSNNIVTSGTARHGSNGIDGSAGAAGSNGSAGHDGDCDGGNRYIGGSGGIGYYSGGRGGSGGASGSNRGSTGYTGHGPDGGDGGTGGAGGNPGRAGSSGGAGGIGSSGLAGTNAARPGTFTATGYSTSQSSNGASGTGGSGGGGGGGGGGQGGVFVIDGTGNSGGGGGGGGHSGSGGTGGTSGHGSFGIYLYAMSNVTITNNRISSGPAGNGGSGGSGGPGGPGGSGGAGASNCTDEIGRGGTGGTGGRGGHGGNGGAGAGGPSIGIAYAATTSGLAIRDNTVLVANASSGGQGGHSGLSVTTYRY